MESVAFAAGDDSTWPDRECPEKASPQYGLLNTISAR
jgi:hypothetical protein